MVNDHIKSTRTEIFGSWLSAVTQDSALRGGEGLHVEIWR